MSKIVKEIVIGKKIESITFLLTLCFLGGKIIPKELEHLMKIIKSAGNKTAQMLIQNNQDLQKNYFIQQKEFKKAVFEALENDRITLIIYNHYRRTI